MEVPASSRTRPDFAQQLFTLRGTIRAVENILGQSRAVELLGDALKSGRLHHAYLFDGPVGVGKCTTALALAKILLCPDAAPDLTGRIAACGACRSCRLADKNDHPDLHVVTKELARVSSVTALRNRKLMNIPVDLLRERIVGGVTGDGKYHEPIAYKTPLLNHNKVFIIDEAERMDPVGQNAMLKTLEEPPAGTFFILICAQQQRLLPTVRSRTQRIAFTCLPDDAVKHWLDRRKVNWDADLREWLVGFAQGSLGRIELAAQYELDQWAQLIRPALAQMSAGRPDPTLGKQIAERIDQFAETWVKNNDNASKDAANKHAVQLMFAMIGHEARRRLSRLAAHGDPADPEQSEARLAPWLKAVDLLHEAEQLIQRNVNLALVCDHLAGALYRHLSQAAAPVEAAN